MNDAELKYVLKQSKRKFEFLVFLHSGNLKSSYLNEPLDLVSHAIRELELREAEQAIAKAQNNGRPRIVCLCGSTRFWRQFQESSLQETLAGRIVLSIGGARAADDDDKSFGGYTPADQYDAVKQQLDSLHFRKIELADEVLVLNVGGYIGESTRNEINHALSLKKPVRYLENSKALAGEEAA